MFHYGITDIIRSFFFCLKNLPLSQAVHIPILLSNNVRTIAVKGRIIIDSSMLRPFLIKIGRGGSPGLQCFKSGIHVSDAAQIVFKGSAIISEGTVLRADKGAYIEFGSGFYCNKNCYFRCSESIIIGSNVTLGWNNTFNDSDGHLLKKNGKENINHAPIYIGNHVWITTGCIINKGVSIPDECVVAQRAVVNSVLFESHSLIGGIPAKTIAANVEWME